MIVRLLRMAARVALCLLVLPLAALSRPAPATSSLAQARKEAARRFLAKRGLLGDRGGAARLTSARAAGTAMAMSRTLSRASVAAYAPALLIQPWQVLGPAQVTTSAYGDVTGRVTSISADPNDATGNTVYVGTTGGGVWKSTNVAGPSASVTFSPLTDDLPAFTSGSIASLSIGSVSVQPGGTGVVLAGTGDPNDALDSYYGTGLLRSADGGLTWSLISASNDFPVNSISNYYFFGLAFAGFAWSTQAPNLVVAAVSQSAEGVLVDADEKESHAGDRYSVMGLYYSTDAGQTWLLATITDGPGKVVQTSLVPVAGGGNAATAVVWNPIRKRFYAAVRFHGYYESLDGITWTRLANQPGTGLTAVNCPTHPNSVGSPGCPMWRGALASQPATGDLFALTVDAGLLDQGLWQDLCTAASGNCVSSTVAFSRQLPSTALEDDTGTIPLADYDLTLAAAAAGGDTLLFAGTADIFRCSLAAGCLFRNTTNTATCAAAQVAPFQHAVDATFAGSLSLMYFGNDSGLWRSTDNVGQTQQSCLADDANHFQNLNGGLGSLAEVENLAMDPVDSSILLAGLGVNGTAASSTASQTVWPQVLDGYGSYVAIDPTNSQNWYAQSSSGVGINLCTEGSGCDVAGFGGSPAVGSAQVGSEAFASPLPSPFLLDPQNSANLILGTCHVWRGPANGVGWSTSNLLGGLYSGEAPDCNGDAFIQSIAAAVTNSTGNTEVIYAGMAGIGVDGSPPDAGHLFTAAVSDAAPIPAAWTDLAASPVTNEPAGFNPQAFSVSSVVVDPHDPSGQTIYATIEGFDTLFASTGTLYGSTNGGASWVNLRSNLPGAPANSVAIDPNDANTVYAALDTGVYVTTAVTTCATQNCWSVYGTGLPNAPVIQLATFNSGGQSLLRAATYGRGVWQVPLITAAAAATTVTVAPVSLSFAAQQVQTQSAAQTVTVVNTGTIAMAVKQIVAGGDFAETDNCATSVAAGASCAIQVTFTPTVIGARSATLTIYSNVAGGQTTVPLAGTGIAGGAIVLLPTAMNFGSSLLGVATTPPLNVTISNTGGTAVSLQVPTATGDFSIVANTCSASLAPNFGCTVALAFTPTLSGQRTGIFSIVDAVGTQTATLSGTGVAPATDAVSPAALSFAAQLIGSASTGQGVTLTNSGDSPLNSIAVSITGDFQAANGCSNSLIGHASCSVGVTFVPTRVGAEVGTLTINDMYGRPQTVALTGSGLAPAGISALPATIDFGPWSFTGSGSPAQTVTVTNQGGAALNAFTLTTTGDFAATTANCPIIPSSKTLASGASCSIQVVFSPTQSGPRFGNLIIASPTPAPTFQVPLQGNGFGFSMAVVGSPSVTVASGVAAKYMLQIVPTAGSAGPLALTCASAAPNSTCIVDPALVSLASGVSASVSVTIATVASASLRHESGGGSPAFLTAMLLPTCLFFTLRWIPWTRRRGLPLAAILCLAAISLGCVGCGVTSTGGKQSAPSSGPGSTPSATYNPVVTASGPGINQTVQLTLIVD